MKKIGYFATITTAATIFTQANAFVPALSPESVNSFCVRRTDEPAFSYVSRIRSLHKDLEGEFQTIAKKKFEDERSEQQKKWRSSGIYSKSGEFFNADPTNFTVSFVTASVAIALYPYSVPLAVMIGGMSALLGYDNYNLASGSKSPGILLWNSSWNLGK